jgi:hypothetical protein
MAAETANANGGRIETPFFKFTGTLLRTFSLLRRLEE